MLDGGVSYESSGKNSTYWQLIGTEVFVCAAGWPSTFTTSMAEVGWLAIGENTTTSSGAYVEIVTHMDTRSDE